MKMGERVRQMTRKIKVDQPKMPRILEEAEFQAVYHEEDLYLSNCTISHCFVDGDVLDKAGFSQVVFKSVTFTEVSFQRIDLKIGRASCRERVWVAVVAGLLK